jgi:predicted nucleic acid-binding protein
MYLVDTNIWLERLLDQERSVEVGEFLSAVHSDQMGITDFSVCSIRTSQLEDIRLLKACSFIGTSHR